MEEKSDVRDSSPVWHAKSTSFSKSVWDRKAGQGEREDSECVVTTFAIFGTKNSSRQAFKTKQNIMQTEACEKHCRPFVRDVYGLTVAIRSLKEMRRNLLSLPDVECYCVNSHLRYTVNRNGNLKQIFGIFKLKLELLSPFILHFYSFLYHWMVLHFNFFVELLQCQLRHLTWNTNWPFDI